MPQRRNAFARRITPHLLGLIDAADANDPLARQFEPREDEARLAPEERADPIGDLPHSPVKGVIHRHPDRALLLPTLSCPVHCRFCFRRERIGGKDLSDAELAAALAYLSARTELREIILSGGEPLALPIPRLKKLMTALDGMDQIDSLRLHTRLPIADPARLSLARIAALKTQKPLFLVLHCNHARELSPATASALGRLRAKGVILLSQTVLLKGVNDTVEALAGLLRGLLRLGVKPYYLHHPDLARGTSHFRPSVAEGRRLMRDLRQQVSGLAMPAYILDLPGGKGKVPAGPDHWREDGAVLGPDGEILPYP
jgi:lysine 2,3-aminomutase